MSFFRFSVRARQRIQSSLHSLLSRLRPAVLLHGAELLYSALLLLWFFAPSFTGPRGELVPLLLPLAFLDVARGEVFAFLVVTFITYPIPLFCAAKIAAVFLERRLPSLADPTRAVPIVLNAL